MNWFNKKEGDELLPDLPNTNLPKLPEKDDYQYSADINADINSDKDFYPSLQSTQFNTNTNSQIKSSINARPNFNSPSSFSNDFSNNSLNMPESTNMSKSLISTNMPTLTRQPPAQVEKPYQKTISKVKSTEPVYIRLDKFHTTKQALDEVKAKVSEIEKTILKIKEVREKEVKDLEEWERETQIIKTRLDSIDSNLFDKII